MNAFLQQLCDWLSTDRLSKKVLFIRNIAVGNQLLRMAANHGSPTVNVSTMPVRAYINQLLEAELVRLGLPGLKNEILSRLEDDTLNAEQRDFLSALGGLIDLLSDILGQYADELREKLAAGADKTWIQPMLDSLKRLRAGPPAFEHSVEAVSATNS